MKIALLHACFLALLSSPLAANDWYVATAQSGGSDGEKSPGNKEAPFATLKHAIDRANPGDTILLRAGEHLGPFNLQKPSLTLCAEKDEHPVLTLSKGSDDTSVLMQLFGPDCTIRGLEFKGGEHCLMISGEGALLQDCRMHDSGRITVKLTATAHRCTLSRCEIFNSGLRDASNGIGVAVFGCVGAVLSDCHIHDVASDGVLLHPGSDSCTIERCLIENVRQNGVGLAYAGAEATNGACLNRITVHNCILREIQGAAVSMFAGSRTRIAHNTIVNAGIRYHPALWVEPVRHGSQITANSDLELVGNLIILPVSAHEGAIGIGQGAVSGQARIDHNHYHCFDGSFTFTSADAKLVKVPFDDWQRDSGFDQHSSSGDPKIDPNFHLNKGSPCIDAAPQLDWLADDYDGGMRERKKPDIGADEFNAGAILFVPPREGVVGTGGGTGAVRRNMPEKERGPWLEKVCDVIDVKAKADRQKISKAALEAWKKCEDEDKRMAGVYPKLKEDKDLLAIARGEYKKKLKEIWDNCDADLTKKKLLTAEQMQLWQVATRDLRE